VNFLAYFLAFLAFDAAAGRRAVEGVTERFSAGILGVLTSWQLYGAIAARIFAIWMHQNALGAGRLAVVQPGVTLTDPYLSIVWGAFVFGEAMRTGFWIVLAIAAAALMSGSVITLARSADMTGLSAQQEEGHRGGRGRVSGRRRAGAP
jgi:hypothetical protein